MKFTLLLAALASLQLIQARRTPTAPSSSLQDSSQKREAYKRRQAASRDIIRRQREGPKRRQASPPVCADPIGGSNKLINGNFEDQSGAPWVLTSTGAAYYPGFYNDEGYTTGGGGETVAFCSSSDGAPGTVTIVQSTPLCAGVTYTLTFFSGLFDFTANPDRNLGCVVTASVGGVQLSSKKVCDPGSTDTSCPLVSVVYGRNLPYRMDAIDFVPETSGSAEVKFVTACSGDGGHWTPVDQISLVRTA